MKSFQLSENTRTFLSKYQLFEDDSIQQAQLQHRMKLVEAFGIKKGMRVLEIGCGQGDTTVAIADAVGENGYVVAIDIAAPDYGAPVTIGKAAERIKKSPLGERIDFHFEMDFSFFESTIPFDVAVLSHCSWYFRQPRDLFLYFKKIRGLAKHICFAEWDLDFTSITQRPHFFAVSISALYSNFVKNDGNIQNLFHKTQIQQLLQQANFEVVKQLTVEARFLDDGHWEKNHANNIRAEFIKVPPMLQTLVASYYELMNASDGNDHSLNSFIVCAK
ncbi:methyltransferase domain-containing protein [Peribacillus sp. SI8-4]|uniref:SAM-dependent methyltransferase n=1 Tax=Peribacillus sp. SI8-4 TaxID=3048009 RepID=UPI002556CFB6|nr:methyltransferase domain-containing protein [Peribacillus sp. SI8-4]